MSGNAFLKRKRDELTQGNSYATSIHAVSSCVIKLSKIAVATKVYRGSQGATLPSRFRVADEFHLVLRHATQWRLGREMAGRELGTHEVRRDAKTPPPMAPSLASPPDLPRDLP